MPRVKDNVPPLARKGFQRRVGCWGPPGKLRNFKTDHIKLIIAAVTWRKYCRYGVEHCPINQYNFMYCCYLQRSIGISTIFYMEVLHASLTLLNWKKKHYPGIFIVLYSHNKSVLRLRKLTYYPHRINIVLDIIIILYQRFVKFVRVPGQTL